MKHLLRAVSLGACVIKRSLSSSSIRQLSGLIESQSKVPVWGSRKLKFKKKTETSNLAMCDPEIEVQLAPLRAAVKEQVTCNVVYMSM